MNVQEVCAELHAIAPLDVAQSWDRVGLLVGDEQADCRAVLLTIDLTPEVLGEALDHNIDFVLAYHPPLFEALQTVRAASTGTEAIIWRAIRHGVAIYSMHTALDAASGGTNDVLAEMCEAVDPAPFEYADAGEREFKLVVFVPRKDADDVARAMFDAGGGRIGEYEKCSFRIPGTGTFEGSADTSPHIGQAEKFETVEEIRLEMVVPATSLGAAVAALQAAHPYEEPAYDIYPLQPRPRRGIGRVGRLPEATRLADLAGSLKDRVPAPALQLVGQPTARIERVAICVGAAGSLPFKLPLGPGDCLITGEIRHHDALRLRRCGAHAIALGHWASERPVLTPLADRLRRQLPKLQILVSQTDRDPFVTP